MSEIIYAEWRNNNQRVRYPFIDSATMTAENGVVLSQDIFDDARLYPIGGVAGIFLNRITVAGSLVTVAIADVNGELASVSYDAVDNDKDELELFDRYGRPAGMFVSDVERFATLAGFSSGDTVFSRSATEFAGSVAVPMPQYGVVGLLVDGHVFAGDVWLVGTNGVVLNVDDGAIRIDIIGDPYAKLKQCDERGVAFPPFCGLKTINNISGNSAGDFKLFPGANLAKDNIIRIAQDVPGKIGVATATKEGCNGA